MIQSGLFHSDLVFALRNKLSMLKYAIFLVISCSISLQCFALDYKDVRLKQTQPTGELETLSKEFEVLQTAILEIADLDRIYITGGSARAVLDHIFFDKPLKMRDLDISIVMNKETSSDWVNKIGKYLVFKKLGNFTPADVSRRLRLPISLPSLPSTEYHAGYGVYFWSHQGRLYDLSVFDSLQDFELNGLCDIDTTAIVLKSGQSLEDLTGTKKGDSMANLLEVGLVLDSDRGYLQWIQKDPSILRWHEVEMDPFRQVFRLVRTFSKTFQASIPKDDWRALHNVIYAAKRPSHEDLTSQYLLRVMNDVRGAQELKWLQELGVFQHWLPELSNLIAHRAPVELERLFEMPSRSFPGSPLLTVDSGETGLKRFFGLVGELSLQGQLTVMNSVIKHLDPRYSILWVLVELQSELEKTLEFELRDLDLDYMKICIDQALGKRNSSEQLLKQFDLIVKSSSLLPREKFILLVRSILSHSESGLFSNSFDRVFPFLEKTRRREIFEWLAKKRLGVMTGIFDPIHNGSIAAIKTAIKEKLLEEVVLVPVIVSRGNASPLNWEDRLEMMEIGIREIPEAKVIPPGYKPYLNQSTAAFFSQFEMSESIHSNLYHVMGSDAFYRYAHYGLLDKPSMFDVFVVPRPGYPIQVEDRKRQVVTYFNNPDGPLFDEKFTGTNIRQLVKVGCNFSDLVPHDVANKINEKGHYKREGDLQGPITLVSSHIRDRIAVSNQLPNINVIASEPSLVVVDNPEIVMRANLVSSLNEGLGAVLMIEKFLFLPCLNQLLGTCSETWMQSLSLTDFKRWACLNELSDATLKVIVGYAQTKSDISYFQTEMTINLAQLLDRNSELTWDDLFFTRIQDRQTSLVDEAIRKLVRSFLK